MLRSGAFCVLCDEGMEPAVGMEPAEVGAEAVSDGLRICDAGRASEGGASGQGGGGDKSNGDGSDGDDLVVTVTEVPCWRW